jgi:hypothetical protein
MKRIALLCFVSVLAIGVLVGDGPSPTAARQQRMALAPVVFEVAGGVTIALRKAEPVPPAVHVEVCGPDVTQIPFRLPITFGFDGPVVGVTLHDADPGPAIATGVAAHRVTVSLTRDPFTPPEPWQLTVVIALERVPETGRIAVGADETHDVSYWMAPGAASSPPGRGRGCVDLLASGWEPPPRAPLRLAVLR